MVSGPETLRTQETPSVDDEIVIERGTDPPGPRLVWLLATFTVVAVAMTFPNVTRLRSDIPGNRGDSLLVLWIIRSVQIGMPHGWNAMWNAPIFYPTPNTLAYSDTMLPVALVHWPLRLVFGDVLALNLILLSSFVLSCWATYELARRCARHWGAAFVAAFAYTYATVRLGQDGHLQLVIGGSLVPLVVLLLLRTLDVPRTRRAIGLGLALAALALTASYYGAMVALMVVIIAGGWLLTAPTGARRRPLVALGITAAVAAAVVVPFGVKYVNMQKAAAFRSAFVPAYGFHPEDLLLASPGNYLLEHWSVVHSPAIQLSRSGENRVFPGIVATAFFVVGIAVIIRSSLRSGRWSRRVPHTRELLLLTVAGVACIILAIGDWVHVGHTKVTLPFALFRAHVPGFAAIREVERLVLGAHLAIVLIAAVGIDALLRRMRRSLRVPLALALAALVCIECATALQFVRVPTSRDDGGIDAALERRPAGPVAELPITSGIAGTLAYREAPRQLLALRDGHPRVNGYSGYRPTGYNTRARELAGFPSPTALAEARRLGLRYVVLHTTTPFGYTEAAAESRIHRLPPGVAKRIDRFPGGYLIELAGPP